MIGSKIRKLRKDGKLTLHALAEMVGISGAFLAQIEGGHRRAKVDLLAKLAVALGVPVAHFFDDNNATFATAPGADTISIPVYDFTVRAGEFCNHAIDHVEEHLTIPRVLCGDPQACAVRVKGESMAGREIHDGDYVIVSERAKIKPGDLAVVCIDDETIALRVVTFPDGDNKLLVLTSGNSDKKKYPDRIVKRADVKRMLRVINILRSV